MSQGSRLLERTGTLELQSALERGDAWPICEFARRACSDAHFPVEKREEAMVYAARAAATSGNWTEVANWTDRGLALGLDTRLSPWLHHLSGIAQVHVGDCNRAVERLKRFSRMAKGLHGLEALLGDTWEALAQAYRDLNRPGREIGNFERAARCYEAQGRHGKVHDCYAEIAWSYLTGDQPAKAQPYIEYLCVNGPQPRPKVQLALALCYALTGEHTRAAALCQDLLARLTLCHEQKVDVLWILGLLHWRAGEADLARYFTFAAHQFAVYPWCHRQLPRVGALLDLVRGSTDMTV